MRAIHVLRASEHLKFNVCNFLWERGFRRAILFSQLSLKSDWMQHKAAGFGRL